MDYKGYCLWAPDIPNTEAPHYIIVISSCNEEGCYMVVVMSSIKYKEPGEISRYTHDGKYCNFYDSACVLDKGCMLNSSTEKLPRKYSFIRYQWSEEFSADELFKKQILHGYDCKCKIDDVLLKKIQKGATISDELEERFEKYFQYF